MEWLPKCVELEMAVGSQRWLDMMVLYCHNAAGKDREFADRASRMCREMIGRSEETMELVYELETLEGVNPVAETALFLKETIEKDKQRIVLLHDLE